ncbi:MAG: hypothetical protein ACR2QA_09260 [Solirubrobacteraceae bacterium]
MKSPEKVLDFLEKLQSYSDEEIQQAIPFGIPPPVLRGGLSMFAGQVPDNADELDGYLGQLAEFCSSLRSDVRVISEPAPVA